MYCNDHKRRRRCTKRLISQISKLCAFVFTLFLLPQRPLVHDRRRLALSKLRVRFLSSTCLSKPLSRNLPGRVIRPVTRTCLVRNSFRPTLKGKKHKIKYRNSRLSSSCKLCGHCFTFNHNFNNHKCENYTKKERFYKLQN